MNRVIYIFISIAMLACRSEVEQPKDNGSSLYPQDNGREIIYSVDSIVYDDYKLRIDNKPDSFRYQLREVIVSKFTDSQGKQANRVIVYKRLNDSFNWEPYKVVSTNVDEFGMQRLEENTRFLKLTFPPVLNKSWNGNVYNMLGEKDYTYTSVFTKGSIGKFSFDSLVTVQQEDDSNFVEKRKSKEIYAPHIGLVYSQKDSIYYQSYNQTTKFYYWKGLLYRKTMISHQP